MDADCETIWLVLDSSAYIPISKVGLRQAHRQVEGALGAVVLELAEEHTVVAAEADLALSGCHDDLKDRIDLERLGGHDFAHGVYVDDVHMTKVLTKDHVIFFDAVVLFLKDLNVIDTLLKLLVVLLLERVHIEDEKMPIVAADPREIVVHEATEESMATRFFEDDRAEILVVNVQLVAFSSRKDQS